MRIVRTRAIILGLAHLEKVGHIGRTGPIEITPETRAIATLLAALGRGQTEYYANYLRALDVHQVDPSRPDFTNTSRSNALHGAMIGIRRDLGVAGNELDAEVRDAEKHGVVRQMPAVIEGLRAPDVAADIVARFMIAHWRPSDDQPLAEVIAGSLVWVVSLLGVPRQLAVKRWGFTRQVHGLPPIGRPVVTIAALDHPLWSGLTGNSVNRCIVPFSAFRQAGRWIEVAGEEISGFAGFHRSTLKGPECVVMTCPPNPAIAALGATLMPVILTRDDEDRWLTAPSWAQVADMIEPLPSQLVRIHER